MGRLDGKVAIVTGSSSGIGEAVARLYAAEGASVLVNSATSVEAGTAVAKSLPDAHYVQADVSDESQAIGLIDAAVDRWGRLDLVVNNAGIGRPRMVFNLEEDDWDAVVRVHLKGSFAVTRPACRWWRSESKAGRGGYGRVVNTSTGLLLRDAHRARFRSAEIASPIGPACAPTRPDQHNAALRDLSVRRFPRRNV